MIERVERDDRLERLRLELERREVGANERGFRHRGSGATHLRRRDVDPRHLKAGGKALCIGYTRTAAQLEHARPVLQPRNELVLPLSAWVAHDPVAPLGEALAYRVVAPTDELRPRIAHSTTIAP